MRADARALRALSVLVFVCVATASWTPQAMSQVNDSAGNAQNGDNSASTEQEGFSSSGDAIAGGQVISTVGSGRTTINATNTAEDSSAETGDVSGSNSLVAFVGSRAGGSQTGVDISSTGTGSSRLSTDSASWALGPVGQTDPGGSSGIPQTGATVPLAPIGPPGPIGPTVSVVSDPAPVTPASFDTIRDDSSEAARFVHGTLGPFGPVAPPATAG